MKGMQSVQRKRPHLLPPLPNLQPSVLCMENSDLLITRKRLGSPVPKLNDPVEFDYFCDESNEKPAITINELHQRENGKYSFQKFDLLSDPIFGKAKISMLETQSGEKLKTHSQKSEKMNSLLTNLSEKKCEKTSNDMSKNIKSQMVLPLKNHVNTESNEPKFFQIPNRYTLLKPIGEWNRDITEH